MMVCDGVRWCVMVWRCRCEMVCDGVGWCMMVCWYVMVFDGGHVMNMCVYVIGVVCDS
jgi:hypothetical protein